MEPVDNIPGNTSNRSSCGLFLTVAIIIIVLIAAFLILRPNPSGSTPKSNPASPASMH